MGRSLWKGPFIDENLIKAVKFISNREQQHFIAAGSGHASIKAKDTLSLPVAIQQIRVSNERNASKAKQTVGGQSGLNVISNSAITRYKIRTWARQSTILADWVGKIFDVYNGKNFVPVLINSQMVGQKLGSYALTRKLPKHPSAKTGAKGKAAGGKK